VSPSPHLKTETDPVSLNVVFSSHLEFQPLDKVHKPSDSEGSTYLFMRNCVVCVNDSVSIPGCGASNDTVIYRIIQWKECRKNRSWLAL
jgi:hypothetical protein